MRDKVTPRTFRSLLGKPVFAAAIFAATGFFASPASAACISSGSLYCDNTNVAAFKGSSYQSTYTSNGFISGIGDAVQSSGHNFDTYALIATLNQGRTTTTLELKYYTSFDGSELGARYADIFLANSMSTSTKQQSFGYAIALGDQAAANGGTNGGDAKGFYKLTSASSPTSPDPNYYSTSKEVWSSKSSSTYGGMFQGTDGKWYDSPTVATAPSANQLSNFAVWKNETTSSTYSSLGYNYLVDVKLTASNSDFTSLFGGGLSIFWGTGDCSNDAIEAVLSFTPTHVPEPLTLSLFSAGMAGIAAMRLRRKSKAA